MPSPGDASGATPSSSITLSEGTSQLKLGVSVLLVVPLMEITSPLDGVALDLVVHQGEVAAPGAALLTVADLAAVNLVVYVPETKIGQIHLGQEVQVTVDSFPGQTFKGQVAHIADRAEYTPRNVATLEERVNLVFAVEIRLSNDAGLLKPGMPADARFE